jgi:heme/copper-type cytochrome/quinol oxidase subunit 3
MTTPDTTSAPAPGPHRTLDVSDLPSMKLDTHAPLWWGNLLAIFIETTTLAILVATYFYTRRNFHDWPPNRVDRQPILYFNDPNPNLGAATAELILVLLSLAPMIWIDKRARRMEEPPVKLGLWVMFAITLVLITLRAFELPGLKFKWNDNAYGSIVWTTMVMHLTYLIAAGLEFLIMGLWTTIHGLDESHALDVTLAGFYWYWVAATFLVVYAVIFVTPWIT